MREIVFLLEEESAKVMIEGILPKLISTEIPIRFIVFEGKQDLDRQIMRKLKGYNNREARFVILRDQDASDCIHVKNNLKNKCIAANKPDAVVRIACRELESWYLADLTAVEKAYPIIGISELQNKKKYRNPDNLGKPSVELKNLVPEYQKVNGSRKIAEFIDVDNFRSTSFKNFIKSIREIVS